MVLVWPVLVTSYLTPRPMLNAVGPFPLDPIEPLDNCSRCGVLLDVDGAEDAEEDFAEHCHACAVELAWERS